jgi:hypothetical protein
MPVRAALWLFVCCTQNDEGMQHVWVYDWGNPKGRELFVEFIKSFLCVPGSPPACSVCCHAVTAAARY